jgi:hypothetical protein
MSFWNRVVHRITRDDKDTALGIILLKLCKVSQAQVDEALSKQEKSGGLIGAALVELGAVTLHDVAMALEVQSKMRTGERISAELCLLDSVLAESELCSQEVDRAIEQRSTRQSGEHFQLFPRAKAS